ncbi:MAG: nucleoside monophosphate kinase [Clostridium sp.]|nr:nucleoside monophosphate kinase [Clostridium sp.]MCM1443824.1 nucleoside monophosphate kinase [Candidatus Amulumruptor caecigallinarius]
MKNIILIAPPAAGKGTQSSLLKEKYGLIHISTGDLLRNVMGSNSTFGKQITEIVNSGKLVSDEIVIHLLKKKLQELNRSDYYVLDGFPRNLDQAIAYDKIIREIDFPDSIVIFLDLDKNIAINRVLGRVICPKCNAVYNEYFEDSKPKKLGICDNCNTSLQKRSDDDIDTLNKRYDTYYNEIKPLLEYYEKSNRLFKINGNLKEEDVFKQIEKVLEVSNDNH